MLKKKYKRGFDKNSRRHHTACKIKCMEGIREQVFKKQGGILWTGITGLNLGVSGGSCEYGNEYLGYT